MNFHSPTHFALTKGHLMMINARSARTAISAVLCAILLTFTALSAAAQDATPAATETPEPLPNCPAFQGEPNDVRTGYYMGEGLAYLDTSQLREAEFSFTCIIRVIDPGYRQAYLARAKVYENLRDYDNALEDYNNALQINPASVVARNNRGIVLTIIGDYNTAAADFDRAINEDASYLPAYNTRSIIHALKGEFDAALSVIDDGIRRSGADAALAEARDPERPENADPVVVNPAGMQLYALRGILETARALDSFRDYTDLADASTHFADYRITEAAGSLESRLTFDLRLDDGTWMIQSDFTSEA